MSTTRLGRITVYPDAHAVAVSAARRIVASLRRKPDLVLCAATGASPLGTYEELGRIRAEDPSLFRALRLVKLDEWGGLAMDNPATCEAYVRQHLIDALGVSEDRYIGFNSNPDDPEGECAKVAALLRGWEPIDICVLGIGLNGHLGLNEPTTVLNAGPHVAELSETAMTHGMLTATGAEPQFGLTLGMGDLMRAKEILLIALGPSKREPILRMFAEGVTTEFPASFLTLHPNVSVMTDIPFRQDELGGVELYKGE